MKRPSKAGKAVKAPRRKVTKRLNAPRSRTDIQSVLETVCRSAAKLCEAYDASIWRPDGDRLLLAAHYGPITQIDSVPLVRGSVLGCSVLDMRTVHVADFQSNGPNDGSCLAF